MAIDPEYCPMPADMDGGEANTTDYGSELLQIPVKSLNSRYHKISNLGSGSFGIVSLYKVKNGILDSLIEDMNQLPNTLLNPASINYKYSNDLVAIKTMNRKLKKIQDYTNVKEIQFIFSVDSHFNLVQIIDVFIDRTFLKLNIVMENMDQNLYQLMKMRKGNVFSPRTLKSILFQLLSAILHIHKHLFFHRDVKPENILVMQNLNFFGSRSNIPQNQRNNSYIIKLADYGLARHSKNERPFTAYVSTRWYRSPDILLRQGYYSFPVDIWAFGCVAVECATFCPLFPGANELDQCCKIMDFLGNPSKSFQLETLQTYNIYNGNGLNNSNNYHYGSLIPFGGFWDDAKELAQKLGLAFPKSFGYRLENVIQRNDFDPLEKNEFFKMVKSCLTWDPSKRSTAYDLVHSAYFATTMAFLDNQKENEVTIGPTMMPNLYLNNNSNNSKLLKDSNIKRSMIYAGIPTSNIPVTINKNIANQNHPSVTPLKKSTSNKSDVPYLSPQSIKLSHPGLGIKNKFNLINTTNILKTFNGSPTTLNPGLHNHLQNQHHHISDSIINSENDQSIMDLASDPIEDYVNIFPDDSNISELRDKIDHSFDIIANDSTGESNKDISNHFEPIDLSHIDDILNEDDGEEGNYTDHNIAGNVDDDDLEVTAHAREDDYEEDDDDEDDDETESELISIELGKVAMFLQDANTNMKPSDSEILINNPNPHHGNYDLIDEIEYALDDKFQVKHSNEYSWNDHH